MPTTLKKTKKPATAKKAAIKKTKVIFGGLKGQVKVAPDAFEPMELVFTKDGGSSFR